MTVLQPKVSKRAGLISTMPVESRTHLLWRWECVFLSAGRRVAQRREYGGRCFDRVAGAFAHRLPQQALNLSGVMLVGMSDQSIDEVRLD